MQLVPLIEMPCLYTGIWRRFGVHFFEGKVTLDDMKQIEDVSEKWHAKIPGKLVEMVVIVPSDAKMTSDERKQMAHIIRRWEDARTASATVILAEGLRGSLHRSVLTGLQLLAPAPHPTKVFATIPDAAWWLSPHVGQTCGLAVTPEEITAAVDELAARFAARPVKAPVT